jgi:glycosyltransferase involved in cell wall biosynthesis
LKIGIYVPEIQPHAGGAYNFVTQLLERISTVGSVSKHEYVVLTSSSSSFNDLQTYPLPRLTNSLFDKFSLVLSRFVALLSGTTLPDNSSRIAKRINGLIRRTGIDIIWSLAPNSIVFNVPYISTVWDLEHWNKPYFPEFHPHSDSWINIEHTYRTVMTRAALVVVGTETGAIQINQVYGVPRERILINAFPLALNPGNTAREPNLIVYPAQFWAHKNHLVLLKAVSQLPDHLRNQVNLVLTGGDQGNLSHIKRVVSRLNLSQNVKFAGFVSETELQNLYQTARIVVFPSYFGPDNFPPLESLSYNTLTAVADISGAKDYLGDAVVYFPPNDSVKLEAILMNALSDPLWGSEKAQIASLLFANRTWDNYVLNIDLALNDLSLVRENWQ